MLRGAASKVMWVGRATVFMVGLAMILALVLGVASTALAGNLDPLKIGSLKNVATKTTALVGKVATGSAFVVKNPSGGSALDLQVNAGQAPLVANTEAGTATNLSADKLDGLDSSDFASYKRTVVVSPVGTDAQNGSTLLDALSGITDASATKPYLLYIEPGTYDLGTSALQMKQHVDIQGAGELKTLIISNVSGTVGETFCGTGAVRGANDAELRFLTVRHAGNGNCAIAIYNDSASPLLTHVRAESSRSGGDTSIGVLNRHSNPTMTNVTATASGVIGDFYAVSNNESSPTITHSRLTGSSAALSHNGGTAKIALTQLSGSIRRSAGTLQCFDNYDGNLGAVTCP